MSSRSPSRMPRSFSWRPGSSHSGTGPRSSASPVASISRWRQPQQSNQILCDPNQWDGPPAVQWRNQAPSALQNLQSTFQKFETDFQQLRTLLENVLVAGGAG